MKSKVVFLALVLFVAPARAQTLQELNSNTDQVKADRAKKCTAPSDSSDPIELVNSCTALLVDHEIDDKARAAALFSRGSAYMELGRFEQAEADFHAAHAIYPKDAMALYWLGIARARQGNYDAADDAFVNLANTDPDTALRVSFGLDKAGNPFTKILSRKDVANLQPGSAKARFFCGVLYIALRLNDHAVAEFDKAIALEPAYTDAYGYRGDAYRRMGRGDEALADFRHVLERRPGDQEAMHEIAWTLVQEKNYGAAIVEFTAILKIRPDELSSLEERGFLYLRQGQPAEAVADFNVALAINPKLARSLYCRGLAKLKLGDVAGANVDMNAAIAIDPAIADRYAE